MRGWNNFQNLVQYFLDCEDTNLSPGWCLGVKSKCMSAWQRLCTGSDHQGNDMSRSSLLLQSCNDSTNLFVNISLHQQPSVTSSINYKTSLDAADFRASTYIWVKAEVSVPVKQLIYNVESVHYLQRIKSLSTVFVDLTNACHQTNILLILTIDTMMWQLRQNTQTAHSLRTPRIQAR